MKKLLTIVGAILISTFVFAQKDPVKFGKMDENLVKLTSHPINENADAVVLLDYGNTKFRYDDEKGFLFEFVRITRVKVFTKEGLSYGDFEIPYYEDGSAKEDILSVKGFTYNLDGGSVTKSKLTKSSIYHEEETKNRRKVKVSMPDVKEGSVIELTYKMISPFTWNLTTWYFQDEIPTLYSEYRVTIPEYFNYQLLSSGYHPMSVSDKSSTSGTILLQSKTRTEGMATQTTYDNQKINYRATKYRLVAQDVPAFNPEAYVASPSDFISKIEFELMGTQFPNSAYKSYMGTWSSLTNTMLESNSFGKQLDNTGHMKDELEALSLLGSEEEKIVGLVNLVRNQIEWDKRNTKFTTNTLRSAWQARKGGAADINLMLVAGLRKLGIKAEPVIISTRGHGMVREQFAISSQFNYVLASVILGDKEILLDGTDRYLPVGTLPKHALNGKGWRVSKATPGWVDLIPTSKQEQIYNTNLTIGTSGNVNGNLDITSKGYAGYSEHKKLKLKGEEDYIKDFQDNNDSWTMEDYELKNEKGIGEPFNVKYSIEWNENPTVSADRIYFNPTFNQIIDENPFKLEKREYPVDYGYPRSNAYTFTLKIPEGYKAEELPESISYALPDKAASFSYKITEANANELLVTVGFDINKTMFIPSEYTALKDFYDKIVKKCSEQVVIRKMGE